MKILLTGYSGFLGKYLADALTKDGHSLRVILNRTTVARRELHQHTEIIWGSMVDSAVVERAVQDVDAVVHAGWSFRTLPRQHTSPNVLGTGLLVRAAEKAGVSAFAFISSVAVYGVNMVTAEPLSETSPSTLSPEARYPEEKIAAENELNALVRGKMRLAIFRPGPIFDDCGGLAKKIVGRKHPFAIGLGSGRNRMPNIHAADVAQAVVLWLKNGGDRELFNVTPSHERTQAVWVQNWGKRNRPGLRPLFVRPSVVRLAAFGAGMLKKAMGKPGKPNVDYVLACATRDLSYSNAHLKQTLGWTDKETAKCSQPAPDVIA